VLLALPRGGARGVVSAAVAVQAVAAGIGRLAALGAGSAVLVGSRSRLGVGAGRRAAPAAPAVRRRAAHARCPRARPRDVLAEILRGLERGPAAVAAAGAASAGARHVGLSTDRRRTEHGSREGSRSSRRLDDSDVHRHALAEVLVPRNHGIVLFVFEADPLGDGRARVQAVEILDSGDYRVGRIMRVDLDSHGEPRLILGRLCRNELEPDRLGAQLRH